MDFTKITMPIISRDQIKQLVIMYKKELRVTHDEYSVTHTEQKTVQK